MNKENTASLSSLLGKGAKVKVSPPVKTDIVYYLRVTQEDGERAWSSPIWVRKMSSKTIESNKQ